MASERLKISILGGGNGGRASAAYLARRGHHITLYSRSKTRVADLSERRLVARFPDGIDLSVELADVTDNLASAVEGADLIILTVPSSEHADYAARLIPFLDSHVRVLLLPGNVGGSLEVAALWRAAGCTLGSLGETSTLPFAARVQPDRSISITHVRKVLPFAVFRSDNSDAFTRLVDSLFDGVQRKQHVLETSLRNLNAVLHPPGMLLNASRIEQGEQFKFYAEGTTLSVARMIDALDEERVRIAEDFGIQVSTFREEFAAGGYSAPGLSTLDTIRTSPGNLPIAAPTVLKHRYLVEDVLYGLSAMAAFAQEAGVQVPMMQGVIAITRVILDLDSKCQRSGASMGITGLGKNGLLSYVTAPSCSAAL